jgi:hypothetical protein
LFWDPETDMVARFLLEAKWTGKSDLDWTRGYLSRNGRQHRCIQVTEGCVVVTVGLQGLTSAVPLLERRCF